MIKTSIIDFSKDWEHAKEESQGLEKNFVFVRNGIFKTTTTNPHLRKLPESGFFGKWILKYIKCDNANIYLEAAPAFIHEKFFENRVNKKIDLKDQFLKDFENHKMYNVHINIISKIVEFTAMGE